MREHECEMGMEMVLSLALMLDCVADASPLEREGLTGVSLDANDNDSFILFGSPTFAKIDDLLGGQALCPCQWSTGISIFIRVS